MLNVGGGSPSSCDIEGGHFDDPQLQMLRRLKDTTYENKISDEKKSL